MIKGTLIGESLRDGAELTGLGLQVVKIWRGPVGATAAGQPQRWTVLDFEAGEEQAESLAARLAEGLDPDGAWYVDFSTETETFVIFAGRVCRYARGDAAGRAVAAEYARSIGVPEAQLDWAG
jgi:hypothetical protein